ncbi:hypothetical protein [uncultured Paludibaculum sp.]|uniref:hypothetical protein n=1 Tax=uncultured Paludibaculum sp. TaxID=1765020 RepID=UPI002AAB1799|nr:hypothetical protein [uncultured Paludibaculum sp.]
MTHPARLLLLCALATQASACMCSGDNRSVEETYLRSSRVFLGVVERSWTDDIAVFVARFRPAQRLLGNRHVNFQIQESFRGPHQERLTVAATYAGCTFAFLSGELYLVYAQSNPETGELYTSACTGTLDPPRLEEHLPALRVLKRSR